jgi:hypothetical protein
MPVNWNNAGTVSFDRSLQLGMTMGALAREAADRRELRNAFGTLAQNPEDQNALGFVMKHDPRTGVALMDRADDRAFARDATEYLKPTTNVLGGLTAKRPASNVLAPATAPAASFSESFQPVADGSFSVAPAPDAVRPQEGADLSFLGEPSTGRDRAFLRMLQRNPEKALRLESTLRDRFVSRLKGENEVYGLAMQALGRATDQATWDEALGAVVPAAEAAGMDIFKAVPREFPGADGVMELMKRAQPIKERLNFLLREANVEADNARADRNTQSLIDTREDRLEEYRRHNRAGEGNQRRGQDIASRDRRFRLGREKIVTVKTPQEAMALAPGTKFRTPDGKVKVRP